MSRNPIFRKCKKCDDITPHEHFEQKSKNRQFWVCSECDTIRDLEDIKLVEFKGHTMETPEIEIALMKEPKSIEGVE